VKTLTSPIDHGELYLIALFEKRYSLVYLDFSIMFAGFGVQANFFQFLFMVFLFFLFLLGILELSVIHDSTHRWSLIWGDFDQIQSDGSGLFQGFIRRDDTELIIFMVYYSDR
jgi:hypothetical protein